MKRKRHTPVAEGFSEGVQIIRKLRTADQLLNQGQTVADVCRALAIDQAACGEEHPEVASDLSNLGALLKITGRLDEAEALMRGALAIDQAAFGGGASQRCQGPQQPGAGAAGQ